MSCYFNQNWFKVKKSYAVINFEKPQLQSTEIFATFVPIRVRVFRDSRVG